MIQSKVMRMRNQVRTHKTTSQEQHGDHSFLNCFFANRNLPPHDQGNDKVLAVQSGSLISPACTS